MAEYDLLKLIADIADEGILCVDENGMVTLCNTKAKTVTGIMLENSRSHPAGHIAPGDLVLISDNILGDDDGGMEPADLSLLGISDPSLVSGATVLAAGVYRGTEKPIYRTWSKNTGEPKMVLSASYLGHALHLEVDWQEKLLVIEVDGERYELRFLRAMANAVVLDGATGQVKFFQDKGCTIRHEDLKELLSGAPFQAKDEGVTEFDSVGRDFFELFMSGELTKRMDQILLGQSSGVINEELYVNLRPMLCSLYPLPSGGAVLKMLDLSELHQMLAERNELILKVEQSNLNLVNRTMGVPEGSFADFVGSSLPMQRVKYFAYRAAQSRCNVIITGESGTGKSQLALEIHKLSRPGKPFVEVNCASIPRDLFESELFGYVGGAFTGALANGKPGYFEQANGGTIFLDEISELPLDIQVKLLYVIQNKRFYRIGDTKPTDVDVRILSATNQNLMELVRQKVFREDLYYRIFVFPIRIPPLRERISDLYLLCKRLTETYCVQYGLPQKSLSGQAVEKLLHYDWPGNIRELGNVIERAIAISEASIIGPDDISLENVFCGDGGESPPTPPGGTLKEQLALAEELALRQAMLAAGGDKKRVMEMLDLKKSSLYARLQRYGIESAE